VGWRFESSRDHFVKKSPTRGFSHGEILKIALFGNKPREKDVLPSLEVFMQLKRTFFPLLVLSLTACAPVLVSTPTAPAAFPTDEEIEVRAVVEDFGRSLQNVSLLSPTAAEDIEQQYAQFVSPHLLQAWIADPSSAPGRLTSSPWPDHIEITKFELQSDGSYIVIGRIVEMTSSGEAGRQTVELNVDSIDAQWLITGYVAGEYE
jgi:hypothetical protein